MAIQNYPDAENRTQTRKRDTISVYELQQNLINKKISIPYIKTCIFCPRLKSIRKKLFTMKVKSPKFSLSLNSKLVFTISHFLTYHRNNIFCCSNDNNLLVFLFFFFLSLPLPMVIQNLAVSLSTHM